MPGVLSDKNGALMTTSPTTMHTEKFPNKTKQKETKEKHSRPHLSPSVSFFLVKGKAT